jgi:hypothetical protein
MNVNDQDYGFPFKKPVKLEEGKNFHQELPSEELAADKNVAEQLTVQEAISDTASSIRSDDSKPAAKVGIEASTEVIHHEPSLGSKKVEPKERQKVATETAAKSPNHSKGLTYFLFTSILLLLSVMAYFLYYDSNEHEDSLEQVQVSESAAVTIEATPMPVITEESAESEIPESIDPIVLETENLADASTPGRGQNGTLSRGVITEVISKEQSPRYFIVVGSVPNLIMAKEESEKYLAKGLDLWMILPNEDSKNVRLAIGKYSSFREASNALQPAKAQFSESVWILKY